MGLSDWFYKLGYKQGKAAAERQNRNYTPPPDNYVEKYDLEMGRYPIYKKKSDVTITKQGSYYKGSDGAYYKRMHINDMEPDEYYRYANIRWRILQKKGDTALVIAWKIISGNSFSDKKHGLLYSDCYIREWLNDYFYNNAFNDSERARIISTEVCNNAESTGFSNNKCYCDNTYDKIFLLSHYEAERYLTKEDRIIRPTSYAGLFLPGGWSRYDDWMLRSPSNNIVNGAYGKFVLDDYHKYVKIGFNKYTDPQNYSVQHVTSVGSFASRGVYGNVGIVPAMWIKL